MNTWYHEYKECKILVWVKGECRGIASYGSIFVVTLQCEVKSEVNIVFFLIYNHYCFSALVNTAEIRVSIIHAQLSKTVHGDQFTSKLLLIRTRNSKGQCDNYDFHYRQINTLFHCSQLLSISSKCMSGNFFFFPVVLI